MVSHPETGSDSPIGSDRDRGRDSRSLKCRPVAHDLCLNLYSSLSDLFVTEKALA